MGRPESLSSESRVAILLHGGLLGEHGKTGLGLLRYGSFPVVAVIDREQAGGSLAHLTGIAKDIPIVASVEEALAHRPECLVIGIAPSGGQLPPAWREELGLALRAGLSLVNGLHTPLAEDPQFRQWLQPGAWIWDIRREPPNLSVGKALARTLPCKRVLTVGTDMSVGKMSTSLELHRAQPEAGPALPLFGHRANRDPDRRRGDPLGCGASGLCQWGGGATDHALWL
jgi:Uncharacterized conserved protein